MQQRPSLARDYFQQIANKGNRAFEFLQGLIDAHPPTFENDWLDFKGWWNQKDENIKETWSKALSGFANNQGGVLIWGIEAKKIEGVDAAHELKLVDKPTALTTRLMELHHVATDPPIPGVEVIPISSNKHGKRGFVVCFVPESHFAPHRAEHCANKPFFIRVGDDFVPAGVSMLRRLFYPHSTAILVPVVHASMTKGDNGRYNFNIQVEIQNRGTASAEQAFVQVNNNFGRPVELFPNLNFWVGPNLHQKGCRCKETIHPGQSIPLLSNLCTRGDYDVPPEDETFSITFKVFALHAPPAELQVSFGSEELLLATVNCRKVVRESFLVSSATF